MTTSFIFDVLTDLKNRDLDISKLTFILPNKRAGLFLKKSFAEVVGKTSFTPHILSIEEFIEKIAGIKYVDNLQLLFMFYDVYKSKTPKEQVEPLENVMHWANTLIQDFNNIDRYLIPPDNIFDYLNAIKELDHWSLQENKSENVINYLNFWSWLKTYYFEFKKVLLNSKIGYQGLVYREAVNHIEKFVENIPIEEYYVFTGFNALNQAEEKIIQRLLLENKASIYWDADEFFLNSNIHDAGYFLRRYKNGWPYYHKNAFRNISSNYVKHKNIQVVATPKNIGQVKYVGNLLDKIKKTEATLSETAVVLADESLLLPLLNSLPIDVGAINVTMGVPLSYIPASHFFELLFKIHKTNSDTYYFRDIINILNHPLVKSHFGDSKSYKGLINEIQENNLTILPYRKILELSNENQALLTLLFQPWKSVEAAISNCIEIVHFIKKSIDESKKDDVLTLEFLFRFYQLFNEIISLNEQNGSINSIASLHLVFSQLLSRETLDFKGEPLRGLQIMGVLETRVLDFKNVIMLSVNEGIIPSGKSDNSFIPFDVKLENGMPTYKELDAVYTYHFYRLIQRAENVYLVYNSEPDVLNGGEKSRFINQMEFEGPHDIKYITASSEVPVNSIELNQIAKSDLVINRIKEIANKGFSPSSLTNYIRNPIDFYYQTVLGIDELEDVEETVAANTMGTIVHDSLEYLYLPFVGHILTVDELISTKTKIEPTIDKFFTKSYKGGQRTQGKNLIIFETCKYYVQKFIEKEINLINNGNKIEIISLEKSLETTLNIEGVDFPVKLRGKVDRIDSYNGVTRIIDYKTGKVSQSEVELVDWRDLITDYKKYSKSFQVLSYAYLLNSAQPFNEAEAGIISFKNLKDNFFLKFAQKPSVRSRTKNSIITQDTLAAFREQLVEVIKEICNPKIDFIEKEV